MDTCIHEEVISSNQPNDFTIPPQKRSEPCPISLDISEMGGERALAVIDPLSKESSIYININLHNQRKPTQLYAFIWLLHACMVNVQTEAAAS